MTVADWTRTVQVADGLVMRITQQTAVMRLRFAVIPGDDNVTILGNKTLRDQLGIDVEWRTHKPEWEEAAKTKRLWVGYEG